MSLHETRQPNPRNPAAIAVPLIGNKKNVKNTNKAVENANKTDESQP